MVFNEQFVRLSGLTICTSCTEICPLQRRTYLLYLLGHRFQYWLDGFCVEHGHFQRWKADSDSSASRNKVKGKFFREKYSELYTPCCGTQPRTKMSKSGEPTALFPEIGTADVTITRPRLSRKTLRNKERQRWRTRISRWITFPKEGLNRPVIAPVMMKMKR